MVPHVKTFFYEFIVNFYDCLGRFAMLHPVLFLLETYRSRCCLVLRNREPYAVSQRCIPEYKREYWLSILSTFEIPQYRFSQS